MNSARPELTGADYDLFEKQTHLLIRGAKQVMAAGV
ncbi:hypothetical protein N172_02860 [Pantoea dispersa EGD-AAK13]|jgi:hypothetical protein|nr:hypothetical protein N172_02860 [Pantoea dispersa EGD-AAK13]